ncbi:MAG: methyltransferase domain-containing protein [Candidatus Solibacter usitatus]|nr:methyltransferase domain-containing protein [Candidatus Solibacter usitatus]
MAEFTGERVIPNQVDPDLFNEHLARYAFAARLAGKKRVLDAGCGTGYGSAALACQARDVLGIDISAEAVAYAREHFGAENIRFEQASCTAIPAAAQSFDVIAAFEIIEHLTDWREFLREARRVLAPGGLFLVSTPNKSYYAETRRREGPNPFHQHEFELEEFRRELLAIFPSVSLYFENHTEAILFEPEGAPAGVAAEFEQGRNTGPTAHFFLAVCGVEAVAGIPALIYVPRAGNVLREREHHIELLAGELATKNQWVADRDTRIVDLQDELRSEQAKARARIDQLEEENRHTLSVAKRVVQELEDKCDELARCVDLLHAAERKAEEKQQESDELRGRILASRWFKLGRKLNLGPVVDPRK